ncbi:hypothetical protein CY35_16G031200 [Sphagnum magellanicum]|nr:hypothetical protein CY35_16G031200 [Sphagnum magellanicum]
MAALEWEEAQEPLHHDIDTVCMLSRQVYWSWTRSASISLGKVGRTSNTSSSDWFGSMCSWGDTSMSEWKKGAFLYNTMIQRTKAVH